MTKTKRAGSVAAEDRPERVQKACESLILRPIEHTPQGGRPDRRASGVRRPPERCTPMHVQSTRIAAERADDGTA